MFLDKTLYSQSASLHRGEKMNTDKFNAEGNSENLGTRLC